MGAKTAIACGIVEPNSSGQGHHPDHAANPYHEILTSAGFEYSHSVPVVYGDEPCLHHSYRRGARGVGVHKAPGEASWRWGAKASAASGRETRGRTAEALRRYLKNLRDGARPRRGGRPGR